MKSPHRLRPHFLLACWLLIATTQGGCAALNLKSLGFEPGADDLEQAEDPIAAAAAQFHSPEKPTAATHLDSRRTSFESRRSEPEDSLQRNEHIALGMGMGEVTGIWGEPNDVETAGDARQGNQRWTYFSGVSSRWGLGARRVVYFESGQVAGWKTLQ